MDNVNSRNALAQVRDRIDDNLVDGVGALASAEDEQGLCIVGILFSDLEKGFAHWNACHFATAEIASSFGEVHGGSGNQRCYQAIGESGHEVRLKHESGNS